MSKNTLRVRETKRGTTIRATGNAAQQLFDALTGESEKRNQPSPRMEGRPMASEWRMAPVEPTALMCEAGACVPLRNKQSESAWMGEIYTAMLEAAPQPDTVKPVYLCHHCGADTPPPGPYKLTVRCNECFHLTAATIALDLGTNAAKSDTVAVERDERAAFEKAFAAEFGETPDLIARFRSGDSYADKQVAQFWRVARALLDQSH